MTNNKHTKVYSERERHTKCNETVTTAAVNVDRKRWRGATREFRLKISAAQTAKCFRDEKLLWYKTAHSSQSVSRRSALNAHQEQSETSCCLLAPLGAFVTTTLFFIVHKWIRTELPESSSDETDRIASRRNRINNSGIRNVPHLTKCFPTRNNNPQIHLFLLCTVGLDYVLDTVRET